MSQAKILALAAAMAIVPSKATMDAATLTLTRSKGYDDALAPIWAHKLIHTYQGVQEIEYPELAAANGDVLSIDTSVPHTANEWEYYQIDHHGHADWIDDEGNLSTSSAVTTKRFRGEAHNLGHGWNLNMFDLERAAAADLPIDTIKRNASVEYHARWTNWVWLFGDSGKKLPGLANHPNINVALAPLNEGATSRLPENKSNDEIIADFTLAIETAADKTIRKFHTDKVFVSAKLVKLCRRRLIGLDNGFKSLWDYIKDLYSGDETGQGKVSFRILNECDPALRAHPKTGDDASGIEGEFILAIPKAPTDDLAFMRMRPFTSEAPEKRGYNVYNANHSKIGGCKCRIPLAVTCVRFGTT